MKYKKINGFNIKISKNVNGNVCAFQFVCKISKNFAYHNVGCPVPLFKKNILEDFVQIELFSKVKEVNYINGKNDMVPLLPLLLGYLKNSQGLPSWYMSHVKKKLFRNLTNKTDALTSEGTISIFYFSSIKTTYNKIKDIC